MCKTSNAASAPAKSASRSVNRAGRHACTDILGGDHGDRPVLGDVVEVCLEKHYHLHPVRVDATSVWPEEVAASTEIAFHLRGSRPVPKHLLRDRRKLGKLVPACASPPRQHVLAVQLHNICLKNREGEAMILFQRRAKNNRGAAQETFIFVCISTPKKILSPQNLLPQRPALLTCSTRLPVTLATDFEVDIPRSFA